MKRKSIYKYASEAGVPVGLYLTAISACLLLSIKINILGSLILPLALVFPFFLGWIIKKIGKSEPSYMKFSSLWLGGIYSVIFGTLICMFFSAIYIVFVEPGFVELYFLNMIDAIESSPFAEQYDASVSLIREAMAAKMLPSGLDFITSMGWFTCFTGSILSLILALLITRTSNKVSKAVG